MLSKADTPDALKRCQPIFSKLVDPKSTGTLMTEINDLASRVRDEDAREEDDQEGPATHDDAESAPWNPKLAGLVEDDLRRAYRNFTSADCPIHARFLSHTTISGFVHSTRQKHQGNSQVFFSSINNTISVPGFIESIFTFKDDPRQFLAVRRLLSTSVHDPFQRWPFLGIKMYDNSLGDLEVILPENIHIQFASCPLEWDNAPSVAVVSLARVRLCYSHPDQRKF